MSKQGLKPERRSEVRIVAGILLAFAVILFAALVLLGAGTEQAKSTGWVSHSRDVINAVNTLVNHLSDAENGRRGYVISGEERFLAHHTNGLNRVASSLIELRALTEASPMQSAACDELARLIELRVQVFGKSIESRRARGFDAGSQTAFMEEGQRAMEPIRVLAARMIAEEHRHLEEQLATQDKDVEGARGLAVLISLFALLLFFSLLWLLLRANRRRRLVEEDLILSHRELEDRVRQRTMELESANQEIQRVNEQLDVRVRERTAQLEEANRELESFSYSVSHDLRAPLRHIQGYAEMLQRNADGKLDEKARRFLQTIIDAGGEMGRLIDDLLDFSRIGRADLRTVPVPLDDLVREVIDGLELTVRDRAIEWNIDPLPVVVGDPSILRQAVANLIANAVKYTGGRPRAKIEIGSRNDADGMVVVHVRDNGAGFDMAYVDKLFGVFQRLHRSDEFEGTGIGLATVRRVISRHGGKTWAEGAIDQGATFYFTLKPAAKNGG